MTLVSDRVASNAPAAPDSAHERRSVWPGVTLGLVGSVYAAATIALGLHLPLGRDEVVYASQVSRFHDPAFFSAPRARGVTWLVAPLLQVTDGVPALRVYVGILSGVGLVAAFWPWLRVRGLTSPWVVPAAAGLFASTWLTLFYGNAVMPNLWVAYGALAATGLLLRRAQGGAHPWVGVLGLAATVGFVTLVRPTDGAVLLGLLALAAIALLRVRSWPVVLAGVAAFALAFVPWAVEAVNRFGGVLPRLRDASGTEGGFLGPTSLLLPLRVVNGPLLCRPTCRAAHGPLPVNGLAWWGVWAALALVAVVLAARRGNSSVVLVPLWVGLGMGVPYVVAVDYAAPRFLHPVYALLSVVVAEGVFAVGSRARRLQVAWAVVAVAAFAVFVGNQAPIASGIAHREAVKRDKQLAVAQELRAAGIRPGCMISGTEAPVIAFALRCGSSAVNGHDADITRPELAAMAQHRQVVLLRQPGTTLTPPSWGLNQWQEGFTAPIRANKPLVDVFLPIDLTPTPNGRP
jgi:hypothetical protein